MNFFNPVSKTLHVITSEAGAQKFAQHFTADCHPVDPLAPPHLGRLHNGNPSLFFSQKDRQLHRGAYDISHASNNDLIPTEINQTIVYG